MNHLKPLFVRSHIDGIPIAKMLVDCGGYKSNAKGVTSVELTIETKTLAAAFFIADVEGNYSLILGRDWIHANQCVPSMLHQMLLQWVGDEVEQVHADVSACIAVDDTLYFGLMRLLRVSQE